MAILLVGWVLATACARSDLGPVVDGALSLGLVLDVYPGYGNWNDYVQRSRSDLDWLAQPGVPCTGDEAGPYSACVHGGERKRVAIIGAQSCDGLTAADDLGAFDWQCRAEAGAVWLVSLALNPERGLRDLVDATGFRSNRVRLFRHGREAAVTEARRGWWDNPVIAVAENPGPEMQPLAQAGAVYVAPRTLVTAGYSLEADRVAFVTVPGVVLVHDGNSTPRCNEYRGERASPDRTCLLIAGGQRFLWLEAAIEAMATGGNRATEPACFADVSFSQFRHFAVANAASNNFRFHGASRANFIYRVAVANCDDENSNVHTASAENVFYSFKSFNAGYQGFSEWDSPGGNVFVDVFASGNNQENFTLTGPSVVSHATLVSGYGPGLLVEDGGNVLAQVLLLDHSGNGLTIESVAGLRAANLVVGNNGGDAIGAASGSDFVFSGVFAHGGNAGECTATAGAVPGMTEGCGPAGASSHELRLLADPSASFVGVVGSADPANASANTVGEALNDGSLDWFSFSSWYRAWADRGTQVGGRARGKCGTGCDCTIVDWRVRASDTELRNRSGGGPTANEAFIADRPCPGAVHGDRVLAAPGVAGQPFLVNATEVMFDAVGDDDGLCESDEACIYSPNLGGAYQGEGDWRAGGTCNFVDGRVHGVRMYAYPINGP